MKFPSLRSVKFSPLPALILGLFVIGILPAVTPAARADDPPKDDPAVVGQWSPVQNWPVVPIHTHLLATGKVMFFPGWDGSGDDPHLWDPATNKFTSLPKAGYDIFCSGHSFLADGRLLVSGGHIDNDIGFAHASIYDPWKNTWTRLDEMNAGRWYPTNTTLANGDILVSSGDIDLDRGLNLIPQVYEAATGKWRSLTDAELEQPYYPFMHLAPNGKVFSSGPTGLTMYLDTTGTGKWTNLGYTNSGYRDYGSSVVYDVGKILIVGGHDPPIATAEVIDLNDAAPKWRLVGSLETKRRQSNATVLPDGRVLATGGSSGKGFNNDKAPVYTAEMWDPVTEKWTTMASATVYRGYHSMALLLPDGRVVVGGSNYTPNVEIYSPPYLFKGDRPTISEAPEAVKYAETFTVKTPHAGDIARVAWVRPGSVTHSYNQDQRYQTLKFEVKGEDLSVTAPETGNVSPPGYYMLFLLNAKGVPSVAKFVHIGGDFTPPPPPPTDPDPDHDIDPDLPAPENLRGESNSPTTIDIGWKDRAITEKGARIERSLDGTEWTQIAELARNESDYTDTGLTPDTTHYYRARYFSAVGLSPWSNVAEIRTMEEPPPPPVLGCGDLDGSGATEVGDAVELLRYVIGLAELTDAQMDAADTNHDGNVDVTDAVNILRITAGLDTPCDGSG